MATANTQTTTTELSLSLGRFWDNLTSWLRNLGNSSPHQSTGYYDSKEYDRQKTTKRALARLELLKLETYQLP